jgi:hypothetical protein
VGERLWVMRGGLVPALRGPARQVRVLRTQNYGNCAPGYNDIHLGADGRPPRSLSLPSAINARAPGGRSVWRSALSVPLE